MDHRTTLLRELVRRRDLASAQIRSLMAGRDLVVEALGQVGALVAGVTEGLQEIGTTPADFVQLDPDVEGMASEANVVVAVSRTPKSTARAKAHRRPGGGRPRRRLSDDSSRRSRPRQGVRADQTRVWRAHFRST